MLDTLQEVDRLLGESYYPTYFLFCKLIRHGIDGLFEQYSARKSRTEFSKSENLGARDHLVVWTKPQRPGWMSRDEYDQIQTTLNVCKFHADGKIMITTFLRPKEAPRNVLA